MLILLSALQREFAQNPPSLEEAREKLPMLGFPIDGLEAHGTDWVLDMDVTANRGDMMSHRGAARDLAAALGRELAPLGLEPLVPTAPAREIRLETPACPIYATAVLTLGEGSTPEPARAFLSALGLGVKGLPAVDASNELLHRYGHPTHAFDADTLRGAIVVRFAKAGEKLVTLDGVERSLTSEDIVIADDRGPIALGGVMGGEATKVTEATKRVLLESAWFDPKVVRLTARRLNLHTDGAHRFGRGADPAMAEAVMQLFCRRMEDWAGAKVEAAWTVGALPARPAAIRLGLDKLARIAGEPIASEEAAAHLARLGCAVTREAEGLAAVPPTWRHDVAIAEDLAEEVLRLWGYDRLGSALPPLQSDPEPLAEATRKARAVASRLAHLGFFQTVTYGFVAPDEDAPFATTPAEGRTLGNPLGLEYSVLRSSLLPSLRAVAERNLRQGACEVRLFEVAPTYAATPEGPRPRTTVALVWAGTLEERAPLGSEQARPRPVHPADLQGVARSLGVRPEPAVRELGDGLLGLEFGLEELPALSERVIPAFRPFGRTQAVERDLSLLVALDQGYAAFQAALAAAVPADLTVEGHPRCVDVFRHKSLPAGKQAWLMRFRFQHPERTLTSEEVDGWMKAALEAARSQGAELRG